MVTSAAMMIWFSFTAACALYPWIAGWPLVRTIRES